MSNNLLSTGKRRALGFAFAAILLSSCASAPPPPPPVPLEVRVPFPVSCITETPQEPTYALPLLAEDADIWTQVSTVLSDMYQRMGYVAELQAVIEACK